MREASALCLVGCLRFDTDSAAEALGVEEGSKGYA